VRPGYIFAAHHERIILECEELEQGKNLRLVVSSPPRSGKSLLTSILAPAWVLGRRPEWDVVVASYGAELSQTFGRQFRNLLRSPEFKEVFPELELDESSQSIENMRTTVNGGALFLGRGGPLTGRGFNWGVVDDSLKDSTEASSAIIKAALVEWFRSVFLTRQAPNARLCITATRWALDDLTGTVLREAAEGGEAYRHLHFKAITEEGLALWPERYPLEDVERTRIAVGPRVWRCLYLNDPVAELGNFFQAHWLEKTFTPMDIPRGSRLVAASDFALSAGAGDYSVHVVVAIVFNALGGDEYYVKDMWRKQAPIDESISALIAMLQKHRDVSAYLCEHDNILQASAPYIAEKFHAAQLHPRFVKLSRVGNKEAKAGPLQGALEAGRVFFPVAAPWLTEFATEMLQFPDGLHDDQVDALANVLRGVVGGAIKAKRTGNVYDFQPAYDRAKPFGGNVRLQDLWTQAKRSGQQRI
jgi:predicted phage terminase large subunit-like protein